MIVGQGNSFIQPNTATPPTVFPPFPLNAADNGLSVDPVTFEIVLGQDVGAPGNPAQLLSNREIPMGLFTFELADNIGNGVAFFDGANKAVRLGDNNNSANGLQIQIDDLVKAIFIDSRNGGFTQIGNVTGGGNSVNILIDDFNTLITATLFGGQFFSLDFFNSLYKLGDIVPSLNGTLFTVDDGNNRFDLSNSALNSVVRINGVNGFTGTVAPPLTITVDGGIVTNVA
jgi:hypothetical protein